MWKFRIILFFVFIAAPVFSFASVFPADTQTFHKAIYSAGQTWTVFSTSTPSTILGVNISRVPPYSIFSFDCDNENPYRINNTTADYIYPPFILLNYVCPNLLYSRFYASTSQSVDYTIIYVNRDIGIYLPNKTEIYVSSILIIIAGLLGVDLIRRVFIMNKR